MRPPNWITTACCVWSQLNTKPVVVRVDIKYGLVGFLQEPRGAGGGGAGGTWRSTTYAQQGAAERNSSQVGMSSQKRAMSTRHTHVRSHVSKRAAGSPREVVGVGDYWGIGALPCKMPVPLPMHTGCGISSFQGCLGIWAKLTRWPVGPPSNSMIL